MEDGLAVPDMVASLPGAPYCLTCPVHPSGQAIVLGPV